MDVVEPRCSRRHINLDEVALDHVPRSVLEVGVAERVVLPPGAEGDVALVRVGIEVQVGESVVVAVQVERGAPGRHLVASHEAETIEGDVIALEQKR